MIDMEDMVMQPIAVVTHVLFFLNCLLKVLCEKRRVAERVEVWGGLIKKIEKKD